MANVGNVRRYGVENVCHVEDYLYARGVGDPAAFVQSFALVDIITVWPALAVMMRAQNNIRNPAGLLWRMLEARERRQKQEKVREDALRL